MLKKRHDQDNVEEYFAGDDSTKAEKVLNELQEMLAYALPTLSSASELSLSSFKVNRKYRFMEQSTLQKRSGMEEKVPELERTLEMIAVLQAKKVRSASTQLRQRLMALL